MNSRRSAEMCIRDRGCTMNKILIIDDDRELWALIKRSVQAENIEADFCNTGKDGLQKLKEQEYQLVVWRNRKTVWQLFLSFSYINTTTYTKRINHLSQLWRQMCIRDSNKELYPIFLFLAQISLVHRQFERADIPFRNCTIYLRCV